MDEPAYVSQCLLGVHEMSSTIDTCHFAAGADLNWSLDAYKALLPLLEDPDITKV